ncbi:hypothetical protein C8R47DRAFT_742664 [Mycena vitilis]|nr:hypothetical protein C8R47DRAFT_742664 [Mycena vitilis]
MFFNLRSLLVSLTLAATVAPALGHACFSECATGGCTPYMIQLCNNVEQNTVSSSNTITQCINAPGGFSKCDHTTINTVTEVVAPVVIPVIPVIPFVPVADPCAQDCSLPRCASACGGRGGYGNGGFGGFGRGAGFGHGGFGRGGFGHGGAYGLVGY